MTPMPTDQEIYESVRQAITAIRRDLGKRVTPECELGAELGLESLDYVDIEFRLETNPSTAVNEVKDAVSRVRADLPRSIGEPIVQRIEIAGLPIVVYGVFAPGKTAEEVSWFVDDTVRRALLGLQGIAAVERVGRIAIRCQVRQGRLLSACQSPRRRSCPLSGLPAIAEFPLLCTVSDSCTCFQNGTSGTVTLAKRLA